MGGLDPVLDTRVVGISAKTRCPAGTILRDGGSWVERFEGSWKGDEVLHMSGLIASTVFGVE